MKRLTPIKAIRQKCIDCCAGRRREVSLCTVKNVRYTRKKTDIDRKIDNLSSKMS